MYVVRSNPAAAAMATAPDVEARERELLLHFVRAYACVCM